MKKIFFLFLVFVFFAASMNSCKKRISTEVPASTNTPDKTGTMHVLSTLVAGQKTAEASLWTATQTPTITITPNMTGTFAAIGTMQAGANEQATQDAAVTQTYIASFWSPTGTATYTITPDETGTAAAIGTSIAEQQSHTRTITPTFTVTPTITRVWEVLGNAGFSGESINSLDMEIHNNIVYVAFQGYMSGSKVVKYNGAAWEQLGSGYLPGSGDPAANVSLSFDDFGNIYVAYRATDNSYAASMYYFSSGMTWAWGGGGLAGSSARFTCLEGINGHMYLAYADGNNGFKATAQDYSSVLGVSGFSEGWTWYLSMDVYENTPYVAYQDLSAAYSGKATVMRYVNSAWENVGNAGFSSSTVKYTSICVDSGTPYVAFSDYKDNSLKATVMRYNGSVWELVGNECFSAGEVEETSIEVYNNIPYVAYSDAGNGGRVMLMMYNGYEWVSIGGVNGVGVGHKPCLYKHNGRIYVAYTDLSLGENLTVRSYGPI